MHSIQTFVSFALFAYAIHFVFNLILFQNGDTAWKKTVKPWKWAFFGLMAWGLALCGDLFRGAAKAAKKRR